MHELRLPWATSLLFARFWCAFCYCFGKGSLEALGSGNAPLQVFCSTLDPSFSLGLLEGIRSCFAGLLKINSFCSHLSYMAGFFKTKIKVETTPENKLQCSGVFHVRIPVLRIEEGRIRSDRCW